MFNLGHASLLLWKVAVGAEHSGEGEGANDDDDDGGDPREEQVNPDQRRLLVHLGPGPVRR